MKFYAISKTLSANDLGETGGHQAGILVPKDSKILGYFPTLDSSVKNPRQELSFYEEDDVTKWNFFFIYYNNKFFNGTRNEYRLTWMTKYLRAKNAKVGDIVEFSIIEDGRRYVKIIRENPVDLEDGVIKLSGTWKVINL
ncbi:EcoRII N-terminal effector-binding domain-containing protein [Arcticibacter tournemirensis]|uniref:Restriction endonuclease type II EcoRII N-terminal domain-containing protein n=1 Tax=Arcticibacter tournemirensis TaxID=699437 RepID=A0A4Q0MCB5_9SPHI|nr:EcoRII N-terminal effector-binding domain-containing protein [Arcticibacter tournemirensis]RXF70529.1 hypothetical protein EKH83_07755 [Arcticibacter tournemirensis]